MISWSGRLLSGYLEKAVCLYSEVGVKAVGIKAVNIYGKEMGVAGDGHGTDGVNEMVGVFDVAGVFCRYGSKEVVYVLRDIVGWAAAI